MKKTDKKNNLFIIINKLKNKIIKNKGYIYLLLSLYILDISLRIFHHDYINFYSWKELVPNLFSIILILFIIYLTNLFKKKFIYIIFYILFLIIFIAQSIYFSYFNTFFDFTVLSLAGEGAFYLISVLLNINKWILVTAIVSIVLTIKGLKNIYFININIKRNIIILTSFVLIYSFIPKLLEKPKEEQIWNEWKYPYSAYKAFNNNNKSLSVSGMFQYTLRDFYFTFLKDNTKVTKDEEKALSDNFKEKDLNKPNKYTGLFKDKNLVLIQFESIDNFLITKDIMPVTYNLMKNGINFTNHYSFTSGGGSTFNSEFMVNTGYSTAFNYNISINDISKNSYDFSLPNLLKEYNYESKVFHMNTGDFYSRRDIYKAFGYKEYYGLREQENNTEYFLDRELILNEEFNKNLFKDKFLNYIITYSAHMPFSPKDGVCSKLTNDKTLKELDCLKLQAGETDNFMKLLLEDLEKKEKLDDTVIIVFSDHYLYTLEDKDYLSKHKIIDNNLINHTPFFIWSSDIKKEEITKVNSQLDILPTILNLLGINYYPSYYLGRDILSDDFKEIVYFNDGSSYNGKTYIKDGDYYFGEKISKEQINKTNTMVKNKMLINDAVLKTNYFNTIR